MAEIDPELLQSPFEETASHRFRGPAIIATFVALGVAAALWIVMRAGTSDPIPEAAATAPTSSMTESVELVAYDTTPVFVTHPTLLPEGWYACSITEDRFEADRFCGETEDEWVEVGYAVPRPSDPETDVPAGLHGGAWADNPDGLEVRFPTNEHVATVVRAKGLQADQVLTIADSIPMIGNKGALYAPYELPIDWESMAADDLVDLLDQFEGNATVDLGRFELGVRTSNATLYGFNSRGYWTPDAATDLPMARIVEAGRPLVVGASTELQKGYAVWDQAGFAWRLEGNLDADEVTALALSVIAKLSELPLATN